MGCAAQGCQRFRQPLQVDAQPVHAGIQLQQHIDALAQFALGKDVGLILCDESPDADAGGAISGNSSGMEKSFQQNDGMGVTLAAQLYRFLNAQYGVPLGRTQCAGGAGKAVAVSIRFHHGQRSGMRRGGTRHAQIVGKGGGVDCGRSADGS